MAGPLLLKALRDVSVSRVFPTQNGRKSENGCSKQGQRGGFRNDYGDLLDERVRESEYVGLVGLDCVRDIKEQVAPWGHGVESRIRENGEGTGVGDCRGDCRGSCTNGCQKVGSGLFESHTGYTSLDCDCIRNFVGRRGRKRTDEGEAVCVLTRYDT